MKLTDFLNQHDITLILFPYIIPSGNVAAFILSLENFIDKTYIMLNDKYHFDKVISIDLNNKILKYTNKSFLTVCKKNCFLLIDDIQEFKKIKCDLSKIKCKIIFLVKNNESEENISYINSDYKILTFNLLNGSPSLIYKLHCSRMNEKMYAFFTENDGEILNYYYKTKLPDLDESKGGWMTSSILSNLNNTKIQQLLTFIILNKDCKHLVYIRKNKFGLTFISTLLDYLNINYSINNDNTNIILTTDFNIKATNVQHIHILEGCDTNEYNSIISNIYNLTHYTPKIENVFFHTYILQNPDGTDTNDTQLYRKYVEYIKKNNEYLEKLHSKALLIKSSSNENIFEV
jgi:hypothetical protein